MVPNFDFRVSVVWQPASKSVPAAKRTHKAMPKGLRFIPAGKGQNPPRGKRRRRRRWPPIFALPGREKNALMSVLTQANPLAQLPFPMKTLKIAVLPGDGIGPEVMDVALQVLQKIAARLTGVPVRSDVAMTGEISLRGLVLPIGGVKEKTLAALRAGIKTVMLPRRNEKDLEDVPPEARAKLEFVFLDRVEDAIRSAIGELPSERKAA